MVPEEKQQQCLVYTCITHLHFKSSMFATAKIFLFPPSNSPLPLRNKVGGKEVEEKKSQQIQNMSILVRSRWRRISPYPLLTAQNQYCSGNRPEFLFPQFLHWASHGLHGGHGLWALREIHFHPILPPETPAVPSLHLPIWPVSSGTLRKDNISTEENILCFLICKILCGVKSYICFPPDWEKPCPEHPA